MKKTNAADRDAELPIVSVNDIPTAPAVCPGAQPPDNDPVNRFASEIDHEWRKSVQSILKVAERCAEAYRSLSVLERSRLLEALPFDRTTFSKLVAIGKNKALTSDTVREKLPANWTILHLLRNCTEDELHKAINAKVLNPKVTRSTLNRWLSFNSNHRKDDQRRAEPNAAHHEKLLAGLLKTFVPPKEWADLWRKSPDAVRRRFCQHIMKA